MSAKKKFSVSVSDTEVISLKRLAQPGETEYGTVSRLLKSILAEAEAMNEPPAPVLVPAMRISNEIVVDRERDIEPVYVNHQANKSVVRQVKSMADQLERQAVRFEELTDALTESTRQHQQLVALLSVKGI